jgi:hypothetical protein
LCVILAFFLSALAGTLNTRATRQTAAIMAAILTMVAWRDRKCLI